MKNLLLTLFVPLLFIFSSCSSIEEFEDNLSTWFGASELELIDSLGVPDKTYEIGERKYLVWENAENYAFTIAGSQPTFTAMDIGGGVTSIIPSGGSPDRYVSGTNTCNVTMILENGFVQSWKYEGNECKASRASQKNTVSDIQLNGSLSVQLVK